MKKLSVFFAMASAVLMMSFAVQAKQNGILELTEWTILDGDPLGQFSVSNAGDEKPAYKIAIVNVDQGAVDMHKVTPNGLECTHHLDSNSAFKSGVCALEPGEVLIVEKDNAVAGDATGTYQLETIG